MRSTAAAVIRSTDGGPLRSWVMDGIFTVFLLQ
jgi:hypothetical protein